MNKSNRSSRKAQLTLWILLGIIVFLIISLSLYVTTSRFLSVRPAEQTLTDFVNGCIAQTAIRGSQLLGERGGYIDPLDYQQSLAQFSQSPRPADGDLLVLNDGQELPYWWYMSTPNTCNDCDLTKKNIPSLEHMRRQIENYVTTHVEECTQEFSAFSDDGVIRTGNISTKLLLTQTGMLAQVKWPVIVRSGNRETRYDEFTASIDIPLTKIHEFATTLLNDEITNQRYERIIMHLVATFSDTKFDALPPIAAVTHTPSTVSWSVPQVEQNLYGILQTYLPLVTYDKTPNAQRIIVESSASAAAQGVFDALYIRAFTEEWPFETRVIVPTTSLYFDISPQESGTISPEIDQTSFPLDLLPQFQTNYYESFYDISLPLVAHIRAPTALKGKGYEFLFAFETNIRDNKNMVEWNRGEGTLGPWDTNTAKKTILVPDVNSGACSCAHEGGRSQEPLDCYNIENTCELDGRKYSNMTACKQNCIAITEPKESALNFTTPLFCQKDLAASGAITFSITDAYTNRSISDADITYGCGTFAACPSGTTDRRGILRTELPYCYNGYVRASKQGYYTNTQLYTADIGKTGIVNASLYPLKTLTVNLGVVDSRIVNQTHECCSPSSIKSTEEVVLSFERINSQPYDAPFVKFITLDQAGGTIDLIPGRYTVSAQLIDRRGYLLVRHCMSFPSDPLHPVPDEDTLVQPGIRGGLVLDPATPFEITAASLQSATQLDLSVIRVSQPQCISSQGCILPNCVGMEELNWVTNLSIDHADEIRPRLN